MPYLDKNDAENNTSVASSGVTMEAQGQSDAFLEFQERIAKVAPIDRPVLIIGERGTGKELAATRLHYLSGRWEGPLVTINCAALPPSLMETELFGHEKGAFTGAVQRRQGRFEAADNGTLFLDEIGNIPMEAQEKILRVVEYGVFERVGGTRPVEVDVRVIGATNSDLPALARANQFKQDLLDRLSFEVLFLPPLRERKGDILLLADHFARRMAYEMGMEDMPSFSPDAAAALEKHIWLGNIRELKNVVERAVYRSTTPRIEFINLDPFQSPYQVEDPKPAAFEPAKKITLSKESKMPDFTRLPLKDAVKSLEINMIKRALENVRYHQKKAAGLLGLTYDQFRGLLRKYSEELRHYEYAGK
ncbi:MAG: phage shock protein operon transcriptional activator [Thermodesulfobacteriota bacterium]|nr:phage shock protein operon transcriptional activator [Thermodesulfobacteriota bacterium]